MAVTILAADIRPAMDTALLPATLQKLGMVLPPGGKDTVMDTEAPPRRRRQVEPTATLITMPITMLDKPTIMRGLELVAPTMVILAMRQPQEPPPQPRREATLTLPRHLLTGRKVTLRLLLLAAKWFVARVLPLHLPTILTLLELVLLLHLQHITEESVLIEPSSE